jgi:hypothetical protein
MLTSTVLSLLFVPVSYTYFDSLQRLFGRVFAWRPGMVAGGSSTATEESTPTPAHDVRRPIGTVGPLAMAGGAPLAAERAQALRGRGRSFGKLRTGSRRGAAAGPRRSNGWNGPSPAGGAAG